MLFDAYSISLETDDRGGGSPLDSVGYVWSEKDPGQVNIDDVLAIYRRLHTFFDMLVFPYSQPVYVKDNWALPSQVFRELCLAISPYMLPCSSSNWVSFA